MSTGYKTDGRPLECNKMLTNTKFTTETVTTANTVPIPASAHASAARPNENRDRNSNSVVTNRQFCKIDK